MALAATFGEVAAASASWATAKPSAVVGAVGAAIAIHLVGGAVASASTASVVATAAGATGLRPAAGAAVDEPTVAEVGSAASCSVALVATEARPVTVAGTSIVVTDSAIDWPCKLRGH